MSRFWTTLASQLTPYVPGEQPRGERLVKLNTNENPYGPSPRVTAALAAVSADSLRRYPDPESRALREALAAREGLSVEQVFVGNGSDEVLAHCFQALLKHDAPLLFPDITYSFYPVWAELYQVPCQTVPLDDAFAARVEDYRQPCSGILLPNPNAPTGILLPLAAIRQLLDEHPDQLVVIDEAYVDFGGESATSLVPEYDNLLVIQTFSKARSLAGLRVGVAYGHRDLIEALVRVKDSFNSYPLDAVAQQLALASVQDEAWFRDCCQRVMTTREQLTADLAGLGFEVLPSGANFVLARHRERSGEGLFRALRERNIFVRYFNKPRISDFLRISVGTDDECNALVQALAEILAAD